MSAIPSEKIRRPHQPQRPKRNKFETPEGYGLRLIAWFLHLVQLGRVQLVMPPTLQELVCIGAAVRFLGVAGAMESGGPLHHLAALWDHINREYDRLRA